MFTFAWANASEVRYVIATMSQSCSRLGLRLWQSSWSFQSCRRRFSQSFWFLLDCFFHSFHGFLVHQSSQVHGTPLLSSLCLVLDKKLWNTDAYSFCCDKFAPEFAQKIWQRIPWADLSVWLIIIARPAGKTEITGSSGSRREAPKFTDITNNKNCFGVWALSWWSTWMWFFFTAWPRSAVDVVQMWLDILRPQKLGNGPLNCSSQKISPVKKCVWLDNVLLVIPKLAGRGTWGSSSLMECNWLMLSHLF